MAPRPASSSDQRASGRTPRRRPFHVNDRAADGVLPALRRAVNEVVDLDRLRTGVPGLIRWYRSAREYMAAEGSGGISWLAAYPQVHDHIESSPYDAHYFFQDTWAAQRIADFAPASHVDVGSRVDLVGFLTSITEVTFVDIRPLDVPIEGLTGIEGSLTGLPFGDSSVNSLSCLHVAEHVGLGRYGDPLDPAGTDKAMGELQRVLAPGGQLLFSGPVGRLRTAFNAHRVQPPGRVIAAFDELELLEFSGLDDEGTFKRFRDPGELEDARYALGLFRFTRP